MVTGSSETGTRRLQLVRLSGGLNPPAPGKLNSIMKALFLFDLYETCKMYRNYRYLLEFSSGADTVPLIGYQCYCVNEFESEYDVR